MFFFLRFFFFFFFFFLYSYKVKYWSFYLFSKTVIKYPMLEYMVTMTAQPLGRPDLPLCLQNRISQHRFPLLLPFFFFFFFGGTFNSRSLTFCLGDRSLNACPPLDYTLPNGRIQPPFARSVPPAFVTMPSTQAFCKHLLGQCSCGFSQLSSENSTDSNL